MISRSILSSYSSLKRALALLPRVIPSRRRKQICLLKLPTVSTMARTRTKHFALPLSFHELGGQTQGLG